MLDARRTYPPRGARPVAEVPVDVVLARADELVRRWVIALLRARPLDGFGELPLDALAREGPSLCEQLLRALQSDVELERLSGRGAHSAPEDSARARRIAAIVGAHDAAAVVEALEALRGVLWEALRDELSEPSTREVGDVADRLAFVCAAALAAALEAPDMLVTPARADEPGAPAAPEPGAREGADVLAPAGLAFIIDEHARSRGGSRSARGPQPAPSHAGKAEIEIRDERSEEGPAAWIRSIGRQLEQFERDGLPFAVLLVELGEIERLRRGEIAEGQLARVERALAATLGARLGSLTRERPGRYWLLKADTGRGGARELAERVAHALGAGVGGGAAASEVAIGTAVCPEDGREASALAAHADVGLYADRSAVRASAGRPTPVEPA